MIQLFFYESIVEISDFTGQENGFKVSVYSRYMVGEMTCLDCVGRPAILMSLPQGSVGIICVHSYRAKEKSSSKSSISSHRARHKKLTTTFFRRTRVAKKYFFTLSAHK